MRFSLITVPALAAAVSAAAISSSDSSEHPATIKNTSSAINSVASEIVKQSPTASASSTVYVTGAAPSTTAAGAASGASKAPPKKTPSPSPSPKKGGKPKPKPSPAKPSKPVKGKPTPPPKGKPAPKPKGKKVAKRQNNVNTDCSPQPQPYSAYTPSVNFPNSTAIIKNFLGDATFAAASKSAVTPPGYSWVYQGFLSSVNMNGYQSVTLQSSYNVTACANICDNTSDCISFSIFYERSPALAPAAGCPNPTAFTNIKCTFYRELITTANATNFGEWRQQFPVVITGANAYTKPRRT